MAESKLLLIITSYPRLKIARILQALSIKCGYKSTVLDTALCDIHFIYTMFRKLAFLCVFFLPHSMAFYVSHPMSVLLCWTWIFLPFFVVIMLVYSGVKFSSSPSYMFLPTVGFCICSSLFSGFHFSGLVFEHIFHSVVHGLNAVRIPNISPILLFFSISPGCKLLPRSHIAAHA
jgi:hypothetical protein